MLRYQSSEYHDMNGRWVHFALNHCFSFLHLLKQEFLEKTEGKRLIGRTSCWWKDNSKINLKIQGGRAWTGSIRLIIATCGERVSNVTNLWVHQGRGFSSLEEKILAVWGRLCFVVLHFRLNSNYLSQAPLHPQNDSLNETNSRSRHFWYWIWRTQPSKPGANKVWRIATVTKKIGSTHRCIAE
jgi:hypothetical protein